MEYEFNEKYWAETPEDELIANMVAAGVPQDVATVAVGAVLVTVGRKTVAEASQGGKWTRVEAPGAGTANDPSPNTLAEARKGMTLG